MINQQKEINHTHIVHKDMDSPKKKCLVLGISVGAALNKTCLSLFYSNLSAQFEAIQAFKDYFSPDFLFTPMDLSVEAECFGGEVFFFDTDAPSIKNRFINSEDQIVHLNIPHVGLKRDKLYLDVASRIVSLKKTTPFFAGATGPFTLAGRLFGITEIFNLTIEDESSTKKLIEKCSQYLLNYIFEFKNIGCDGVLIAEPLAGLLSPGSMHNFSSKYIQSLVGEVQSDDFQVIYHNCGAKKVHLDAIYETGAAVFHFGAPMDMIAALDKSGEGKIVSGNLDPTKIFLSTDHQFVIHSAKELMGVMKPYPNFLIATGCDLNMRTPLQNISSFFSITRTGK